MQRSDNNYYSSYVCDIVCINKLLYLYKYIYAYAEHFTSIMQYRILSASGTNGSNGPS